MGLHANAGEPRIDVAIDRLQIEQRKTNAYISRDDVQFRGVDKQFEMKASPEKVPSNVQALRGSYTACLDVKAADPMDRSYHFRVSSLDGGPSVLKTCRLTCVAFFSVMPQGLRVALGR